MDTGWHSIRIRNTLETEQSILLWEDPEIYQKLVALMYRIDAENQISHSCRFFILLRGANLKDPTGSASVFIFAEIFLGGGARCSIN